MKAFLLSLFKRAAGLNWLGVGQFLFKNWQTVGLVALALFAVKACHDRDNEHVALGKKEVEDSLRLVAVKAWQTTAKAESDTIAQQLSQLVDMKQGYAQDIARLHLSLGRVDTLELERWVHDTVEKAAPGTLIPIPASAIREADTALHACSEYQNKCAAFQAMALRRFALDSGTIASLTKPMTQVKESHWGIQLTAGFGAVGTSKTNVKAGPGAILGVGYKW